MWTGTTTLGQLDDGARWKVEFCCQAAAGPASRYDHVPIGEIFVERREVLNPQESPERSFHFLGLEHVESLTGDLVDFRPRPGSSVRSRSKVYYRGDVLYGRLRPYLNKVFLVDDRVLGDESGGICSSEFYVLVPQTDRIRPLYARTVLASVWVQDVVRDLVTGSALPRLPLEDLLAIDVPLPPVSVQQSIEEFVAAQDAHRRELRRQVEELPAAMFAAVTACLETGMIPERNRHARRDETASRGV